MRNYRSRSLWSAAAPSRPASRGVLAHGAPTHGGLTLVEMLVAMAITLIMMAAVVNLFANIGQGVRNRTATMELINDLRSVHQRLTDDLAGATCPPTTWQRQDAAAGYIEIVEGQYSDKSPTGLTLDLTTSIIPGSQLPGNAGEVTDATSLGDYDDILAQTVRSPSSPFIGRNDGESIASNLAEVIWFAVENPADRSLGEPGLRTIYRRVLLIAPWIGPIDPSTLGMADPTNPNEFFRLCDISARYDAILNRWIPNTLGDLTKRENRFAHFFDATATNLGFPHYMLQGAIRQSSYLNPPADTEGPLRPFGTTFENLGTADPDREGEDVILNNVLAFDVRVFDPDAPLVEISGATLEPSDVGWVAPTTTAEVKGYGSFVDLGWSPSYDATAIPDALEPAFQDRHRAGFPDISNGYPAVYDTWSFHYENDGIDQDGGTTGIDQGTNGLDDNSADGPDDMLERETAPPYDVPLSGIQVKLRTYDPDSRQIRESTVTRKFVPN